MEKTIQGKEVRSITVSNLEIRTEDGKTVLAGYAARFNTLSDGMWFIEKIAPGAFAKTLGENNSIKALWNHNTDFPIASTDSGTLKLSEDDLGLRFEMSPINTSIGNDATEAVRSGVVKGVSFGFITKQDSWDWTDEENPTRTLIEVELLEISPTPFPAYAATSISARSTENVLIEARKAAIKPEIPPQNDYKMGNLRAKMDFLSKRYK